MFEDICVAIPSYRRVEPLRTLLASLDAKVHAFVSDNGDTLPHTFKEEFPNAKFRGTDGKVISIFENWNLASRMATTKWVVIPSDDDIYYPDSFTTIAKYIELYDSADVIIFGHAVVDDDYQVIGNWKPLELTTCSPPNGFEYFKFGVSARMPSIVFKRKLLEELEYFDENFKLTAADSDLIQRALIKGQAVFVPQIVSGYRVWQGGLTHAKIGTKEWMQEVDYWGAKIEELLKDIPQYSGRTSCIRAETYASNLFAGLKNLRTRGMRSEMLKHFFSSKYPYHARVRTQTRIILELLKV